MKHLISLAVAMLTALSVYAYRFDYQFNNTPLAQALVTIGSEHPDINLSFVYTELDNYRTSAQVHTDNAYDAVSEIVGLNPVSVIRKGNNIYVEALQHGKFCYMGRLIVAEDNEPVVAATVMLLAPVDSTVITFGITDNTGRFIIPCDRQEVIGKMSCIGYKTKYKDFSAFNVGDIVMTALPVALGTVTVESDYAQLYSDKSVYIPTSRQKNSSQSGIELINRMAIPQIRLNSSGDITTMAGKEVSIFIDFMPATEAELKGMRMSDVRRVEYYDYPSDPRFQYKSHVINFIMTQYEYGGYGKVYADENLFINSGQIMSYGRLQYKSMTYDIAVGGYYMNNSHIYTDTNEEFRLPQADGAISTIERNSITDDSKLKRHDYWVTGKALYKTDNITMSNTIATDFDHKPQNNSSGTVTYSPEAFESSTYLSRNNEKRNSLSYIGHWNFILSKSDVLVFNPTYSFSHTTANSRYEENRENAFINNASDNSHLMEANLSFTHKFDNGGALKTMLQSYYLNNNTHYSGNRTMDDHAETLRLGPGVSYSYNNEKFHSKTGIGLHYDRSSYGDFKESSATPWIDLSFQYAFNRKNSVNAGFKFVKSIPQPGYRSAVVIQSNPLMSYTGNPLLVPYKSFDCEMSYTLTLPHNIYATAYGYAWIVKDRYAYDYEASPTGILRTIKQPMGMYVQQQYGINISGRFLDNSLQIRLIGYEDVAHNGAPYNWDKTHFTYGIQAFYYRDKFYFGADYTSSQAYPDGCMVGTWMKEKDRYSIHAGWANEQWNIRVYACDFFRWNWLGKRSEMHSKYYDLAQNGYNTYRHCFIKISATYTIGFGKSIKAEQGPTKSSGASSGILK